MIAKDKNDLSIAGSFRDPNGIVFTKNGSVFRQINHTGKDSYDTLLNSGLYDLLKKESLIVEHTEVPINYALTPDAYKIIKPKQIEFISYPYEWCFSQYRDAALTTLKIQRLALDHGMTLKDASAYNIQFLDGKPVLIDTLSFEKYREREPWVAYRQFCQHFLAPLAIMSYKDIRLGQLMRLYIDGIPLDLASSLLPFSSKMKFSLLAHIHLHSKAQKHYAGKEIRNNKKKINREGFIGIINNLESAIKSLKWNPRVTAWSHYYEETSYSEEAFNHKKELISRFIDNISTPRSMWDIGANTGEFSRIASSKGIYTISFDMDHGAVEKNYKRQVSELETNILPLVCDLTNPSPDIGWENEERKSLINRGPVDLVLAVAIIHHLAISNNVPFRGLASFFSKICQYLIIEFIPKTDSMVRMLLSSREDIFHDYNSEAFEKEFGKMFLIEDRKKIKDSDRILFLMRKKNVS